MMNKLFFIVFSVLSAIFAFSSCTKNDYEEALATEMSKSRMTRAAYSITMEEVQERLDELNNIYKTNWIIDKTCDANCYNDSFFLIIENHIRQSIGLEKLQESSTKKFNTHNIMDDSSLYDISVTSTSSYLEDDDKTAKNIIYKGTESSSNSFTTEKLNKNDISPFINYEFDFHYLFHYEETGTNEISFLKLDDKTLYSIENSKDETLTADNLEEIKNRYKISYINNSLKLKDSYIELRCDVKYKKEEELVNSDFEFTYSFQFKINNTTIESLSNYPDGGNLFRIIE